MILSVRIITTWFLFVFFTTTVLLCMYILSSEECHCPTSYGSKLRKVSEATTPTHRLALLIPFRDRFDELLAFIPHMDKFLKKQKIDHHFFVLNQIDILRFNRASLINAGFKLIRNSFDYIAIHDVDLLPLTDELSYNYPVKGVFHVSSPNLHPKYHYASFLGGILLISRETYEKVNGMSNRYWGWGLEDDELFTRLKAANVEIERPTSVSTNQSNTFLHVHDRDRKRRDTRKCFNQLAVTRHRDRVTGLHDVIYRVASNISMTISGVDFTVFNIALVCDHTLTPWCLCDRPPTSNALKT